MIVNNLIVETLDPKHIIAKLYNSKLTKNEKYNLIININKAAKEYQNV